MAETKPLVEAASSGDTCCLCIGRPGSLQSGRDGRCTCQPERANPPLDYCQHEYRECCPCVFEPFKFFLGDRFPFVKWLKQYCVRWLIADGIAGLTVGLMVVPQALAYASIARLPEQVRTRVGSNHK